MNKTWENGKKPSSGNNFAPFGPKFLFHEFYIYYMLDIVESYPCMQFQGKLINQIWENSKKPSFGPDFGPFDPNLGHQFLFSKIWLRLSLDVMVSTISEKTNGPILRKLSDGQMDRLTDESDFIARCPTNVERPKMKTCKLIKNCFSWYKN